MSKELTMLSQPSRELLNSAQMRDLRSALGSSDGIAGFAASFDAGSTVVGGLVQHIHEGGDSAWIKGMLKNGTEILYAKSGSASVLIVPLGDVRVDNIKDLENAKTAEKFRIIFRSPQRSMGVELLVGGGKFIGGLAVTYVLSRVVAAVCRAIVQRLTGVALGALVGDALAQAGLTVRMLTWLGGETVLAGLARFSIATAILYGLYCVWKAWLHREYNHRLWVYNVTGIDLKLTVKHLHNVDDKDAEHNKEQLLPKVLAAGAQDDLVGIAVTSDEAQVGMGYYDFSDDQTFLGGIGSLLLIEPVLTGAPFTNIVATSHIPRFHDNSMSLLFDEKDTDFGAIYNREEGRHQDLMVSAEKGNIKVLHRMDKLGGAEKDTYRSVLLLVDTTSPTGVALIR